MRVFHLVLIKPSHYDDDGYVIQWWRSAMPANSLASVHGLAEDCNERHVLGDDVRIQIHSVDETNTRIRPKHWARLIRRNPGGGIVGLVGVQSNQFPRAMDLARQFRDLGINVCIGGFHVSGSLAMLPQTPVELQQAMDMGISLFAGEAEKHMEVFLRDAFHDRLQPLYNFMDDPPGLSDTPIPILESRTVRRTAGAQTSFDAGRGCPFECSFCTIINVQGRKSRYRTPDDVEQIIKRNLVRGIKRFFITDDNFARNKNWEAIIDRLIEVKEAVDIRFNLVIQVDTLCHKIPNFVDKCVEAGVRRVFIGLENINPDSLKGAKKRQNKITEYRKMVQAWKDKGVFTVAGYILGFPADTRESILRDVEIIKRELPIDMLEFFYLTPLPGSEDHRKLAEAGAELEPDLNKYDLCHVTSGHPLMSKQEWEQAYEDAWRNYYDDAHRVTLLRRARAKGVSLGKIVGMLVTFYSSVAWEGVHPLETGVVRRRYRKDRRPGYAREPLPAFYWNYLRDFVRKHYHMGRMALKLHLIRRDLQNDPSSRDYTDISLSPVTDDEVQVLEIFSVTDASRVAVKTAAKHQALRDARDKTARPATAVAVAIAPGEG